MKRPYYAFGGPKIIRREEFIKYLKSESKRNEEISRSIHETGDREMAGRVNGRMTAIDDLVKLLSDTYGKA